MSCIITALARRSVVLNWQQWHSQTEGLQWAAVKTETDMGCCMAREMNKGHIHSASVRHSTAAVKLIHDASLVGGRSSADHTLYLAPSIGSHTIKTDAPCPSKQSPDEHICEWDYPLIFRSNQPDLVTLKPQAVTANIFQGSLSFLEAEFLSFRDTFGSVLFLYSRSQAMAPVDFSVSCKPGRDWFRQRIFCPQHQSLVFSPGIFMYLIDLGL